MEYLEDYKFTMSYHPVKTNVVANALSRKTYEVVAYMAIKKWKIVKTMVEYRIRSDEQETKCCLCVMVATPALLEKVIKPQKTDLEVFFVKS